MVIGNNLILFLMNAVLCHCHITEDFRLRMSATNMFRLSIFLSWSIIPGLPRVILIINSELIDRIGLVERRLSISQDSLIYSHNADTNINVVNVTILS